jgi:hypothetical protein
LYFVDLTTYSYLRNNEEIPDILNIGWLDSEHPFEKGEVASQYTDKLKEIILSGKCVLRARGMHPCPFCNEPTLVKSDTKYLALGASEIWIPTQNNIIYAAPNMLHHYITAHKYKPPQEFLDAVLDVVFPPDWGEEWVWKEAFKRLKIEFD